MTRATAKLIPPSIADERSRAFGRLMERAIADPDFKVLLFERIDSVDAALLPFLIREFSIEEFVEPDMSDAVIRTLLKGSYELHASKGYISGVRKGLLMLGMRPVWKQWFQQNPKGAAGTHVATVFVNQTIFNGQSVLLDERIQRVAQRMINGMKRWSQDVTLQLAVSTSAKAGVASVAEAAAVAVVSTPASPPTTLGNNVGCAVVADSASMVVGAGNAAPNKTIGPTLGLANVLRSITIIFARMEAQVS